VAMICAKWVLFFLLGVSFVSPKERETVITPDVLTDLQQSFTMDAHLRTTYHALSETDAKELTLDREKINAMDSFFTNKIDSQKITNQESTGRCWLFAGLNILRPVARKNLGVSEIEFSQSYLFFYDKLEKANLFLEGIIRSRTKPYDDRYVEFLMKNTIPDGGQWVGMVELIKKYGVVPKEAFPETYSSSHTSTLNRTLELKLKETAIRLRDPANEKKLDEIKRQALKDVYRILAVNFGEPPRSFRWRFETPEKHLVEYKTYTPQSFYAEEVGVALDDYVSLCSVPTREFNRVYEIDLDKSGGEEKGIDDSRAVRFLRAL
jgi:bleomycin hydrolase